MRRNFVIQIIKHKMKRIFLLSTIVAIGFTSCNDATSRINSDAAGSEAANAIQAQTGTPKFEFDSETVDFGQINEGETKEHVFKFKNVGDAPLIISNAQGSCGCTVPQFSRTPIAPGESGEIKVSFNSQGKGGMQDKTVTLSANTVPNNYVLHVVSEVIPQAAPAE